MSRRMDRVNELLKREISSVLQRDFEWKGTLVTVNSVEVSQDLKDARVYVGVLDGHEVRVIERLNGERGSIQSRVMKRVILKNTPVLRFVGDDSVVRGVDIVNLLDEVYIGSAPTGLTTSGEFVNIGAPRAFTASLIWGF